MARHLFRGLWGTCAILGALLPPDAVAHPTTGFARLHADESKMETRLTLAISALSELAVMDADADETVTRTEIAAALPLVRRKLLELLDLKLNGEPSSVGDVVSVETLWPRDREAGLLGGISLEASYLDITFASTGTTPLRSFSLDLSRLFMTVTSLSGVETTCSIQGQAKQTFVLNAVSAVAGQELLGGAGPTRPQSEDPVGVSRSSGSAYFYLWAGLVVLLGLLAVCRIRRTKA